MTESFQTESFLKESKGACFWCTFDVVIDA
jgi:hypothetical protein